MRTAATKRSRKPSPVDEVFAEHIRLPGIPQLIVTRAFAIQHFRSLGWLADKRGQMSADRMVFIPCEVADPLTDADIRDAWLSEPDIVEHMTYSPDVVEA